MPSGNSHGPLLQGKLKRSTPPVTCIWPQGYDESPHLPFSSHSGIPLPLATTSAGFSGLPGGAIQILTTEQSELLVTIPFPSHGHCTCGFTEETCQRRLTGTKVDCWGTKHIPSFHHCITMAVLLPEI